MRNSTGETRINFLSIYGSLGELATESHHLTILPGIISEETKIYLKAKLKEIDFSIFRREF